jgi:AcrR family transcriptional regulator
MSSRRARPAAPASGRRRKAAVSTARAPAVRARGDEAAAADDGMRTRLVRAAREVLERGGYGTASVLAIAERAGVSAGALYRHFPSKAELFVEVFRAAADGELTALRAVPTVTDGWTSRLEAVVAAYARRALHNRRLAWALVYEPVDPLVDAERLVYRRNYCRGMAALLREGIAAGEFLDEDPDLAAAAIVGAIAETLVGPLSPIGGGTSSEDEIVAGLVRFCRRAMAARPLRTVAKATR